MLIVFEGIDGTGKSTQLSLLTESLKKLGLPVLYSREPTDGPFGQELRRSMTEGRLEPEEELALFHRDRKHHVNTLLAPALQRDEIVILDRYYFSTMAYQGARGFDVDEIRRTNEAFAPQPDLVIILEIPIETALERIGARDGAGNHFEQKDNLTACSLNSFQHPPSNDCPRSLRRSLAEVGCS